MDYSRKVSEIALTTPLDILVDWITPDYQHKDYDVEREGSHNHSFWLGASFGVPFRLQTFSLLTFSLKIVALHLLPSTQVLYHKLYKKFYNALKQVYAFCVPAKSGSDVESSKCYDVNAPKRFFMPIFYCEWLYARRVHNRDLSTRNAPATNKLKVVGG